MDKKYKDLYERAKEARKNSYSPYSGFAVGAAVLTEEGRVFTGCNVENASYGLGCCAERTALFTAVAAGDRKIKAVAIAGGRAGEDCISCPPCGACRQVMSEFANDDTDIILKDRVIKLSELLPLAFELTAPES